MGLIAPLLLAAHGANALTRLQPPTAVASTPSLAAPLQIRGGALSVDDEGNLYSSPRATTQSLSTKDEAPETATIFIPRRRKSSSSPPSSPRTADLASRTVRGSTTTIKNNRFGRLSVDNEGNLYSPPKLQVNARAAALAVRGGGFSRGGPLRVPNEELREELGVTFGCFLFFASLLF